MILIVYISVRKVDFIITNKLPSRKKYQNCFSKNHLSLEQRKKYRDYRYQLCISLDLTGHIPTYTSLKISTYQNRDNEKPDNEVVIVSKYLSREGKAEVKDSIKPEKLDCIDDRKHFGELLFILTAKLKYDLLKNKRTKEDNCGFLHTEDIEKMNPKGPKSDYQPKTKVGKTVCGTLRKFCNGTDKKLRTFVNDLSFEPEQLFHLICYLGITTTRTEVLFWWLNISAADISFQCSANGKKISNTKLKNEFGKLFGVCACNDTELPKRIIVAEENISDDQSQRALVETEHFPKLKYLKDIRDVLRYDSKDDESPKWFRKTGPIAVDFAEGYVYERKELLSELDRLVSNNVISILEGDGGTGKSVLVRNYGYNLINKRSETQILYYSFKIDLSVNDYREFIHELNSVNGIVIIEDVHLAISEMQCVLEEFKHKGNCAILLTTRSTFKVNVLKSRSSIIEELERLSIGAKSEIDYLLGYGSFDDIDGIIDHHIQKRFGNKFLWTSLLRESIKTNCKNSLWLLTYALTSCTENGCSESCIEKGVVDDLEDIERLGGDPEILLALSPLYKYEIPTSQLFMVKKLGYDRSKINKLIEMGEVIKQNINGKIYYGLPHSSLASAYWKYGNNYRECLLFPEYNDFIYNYIISDVSNGLEVMTHNSYEVITYLLNRLARENKILKVIEKEESKHAYSSLSEIFANTIRSDFEWPYVLDKYYYSEEFMEYLLKLLLKNHLFKELSSLTYRYQLILKKHVYSVNIKNLLNEIYASENYGDGCEYLHRICCVNKKVMSDVCKILDPNRLVAAANRDGNYLRKIWIALKYLLFMDRSIGLRFWKGLDKNVIVNTTHEENFEDRWGLLYRICFLDNEIKLDVCKIFDCNKLAEVANKSKLPFATWSTLESLSEIDGALEIEFWNVLDKKLLAKKIFMQKNAEKITGSLCAAYEMSQPIRKEFFEIHFNMKKFEEMVYKQSNFSSLIKGGALSISYHANGSRELFDHLKPSKIEKLYNQHTDLLERIRFLAAICIIKSKTGNKLIHLLRRDAKEFAKTSKQEYDGREIREYNLIADADIEAAQIVYKYICENIGIENYIKKILDMKSSGYKKECFDFLLKVDPENKQDWGQYFNWKPADTSCRRPRKRKMKQPADNKH